MHVLLKINSVLPVSLYGGTERVVWSLARALSAMGHRVSLAALPGSSCPFAEVIELDPRQALDSQLPSSVDIVHFHSGLEETARPYVVTQHGNSLDTRDRNSVYVSRQHAVNHGAECFVHNGLDWDDYPEPCLDRERRGFHFLGKAAWRVKNVRGAISATRRAREKLQVLGGTRLNFTMGFRFTPDRHVTFHGMADDRKKAEVMMHSKGLLFPVTWHEPFGLAITESLFYGCPVFATPYGSLPELVGADFGFLSDSEQELAAALATAGEFSARRCHEYARDCFGADVMARAYVAVYEKAIAGESLNPPGGEPVASFRNLPYFT